MTSPTLIDGLFSLSGTVALVTGASSGIGSRIATTLARAGSSVVALARRRQALDDLVAEIAASGGRGDALCVDLETVDDFADLATAAGRPFGPPTILVNAAGINLREPAEKVTLASWEHTVRINLTVPFFLAQALVAGMRARGRGAIINIASLQSWRAFPNSIAYGASKGGVAQLTRAMAEAWSRDGITANALAPGFFPTALTMPVFENPELADRHAAATAVGRNGEMADLDGAVVFLASPAASYVTGQILPVDGGYTAK